MGDQTRYLPTMIVLPLSSWTDLNRSGNQHNRKGRHVADNDLYRAARKRCGDHGGNTRKIINFSIEKGCQRRRTSYLNELGFDTFF